MPEVGRSIALVQGSCRFAATSAANEQRVTQAGERSNAMSAVLNFTATWKKWCSVLRYRKGFGLLDSLRFGLWLARS